MPKEKETPTIPVALSRLLVARNTLADAVNDEEDRLVADHRPVPSAAALKRARLRRRISVETLADLLQVSRTVVSNAESTKPGVSARSTRLRITALLSGLGVSVPDEPAKAAKLKRKAPSTQKTPAARKTAR